MILTFILLALALALLSFKKIKLSFVVLVISGFLAYYHNIIEISFIVFVGIIINRPIIIQLSFGRKI